MTRNFLRRPHGLRLPVRCLRSRVARPAHAQKAEPCIAGSWELTGALAHTGNAVKIGIEAAVDEINAAGGVLGQKLRVIAYDDQGEPARASTMRGASATRQLHRDDRRLSHAQCARHPHRARRDGAAVDGRDLGRHPRDRVGDRQEQLDVPRLGERPLGGAVPGRERAATENKTKKVGFMFEATGWGQGAVPDIEAAMKAKGVRWSARRPSTSPTRT